MNDLMNEKVNTAVQTIWTYACKVSDIPEDGGACALINGEQIAIFNFARLGKWLASQNLCPHKQQMALSRGMIGTSNNIPKVACPFHKRTFSLIDGHCLNDDDCESIKTYEVKIENGEVYVQI